MSVVILQLNSWCNASVWPACYTDKRMTGVSDTMVQSEEMISKLLDIIWVTFMVSRMPIFGGKEESIFSLNNYQEDGACLKL